MSVSTQPEKMAFGAEVKQLLSLVANALYSNKEIFVRELVSNASDAADKLRYKALSDSALYEQDSDLKIWIDIDKEARIITIRDNGIGMSREEVIENLGTIAKSGTKAFRNLLSGDEAKDSQLIGQFGVGFYSSFVVADNVTVRTRAAGAPTSEGVEWCSAGDGEFTIEQIEYAERGTEIRLHMKEGEDEFLDPYRVRNIIRKYSDHILLPIMMRQEELPKSSDDEEKENTSEENDEIVVLDYEQVNEASALWTLSKGEIKDEDYQALYKHISHDFEDPLAWSHNKVEGKLEYTSLLYIPKRAPFNLWERDAQRGLKLYVKRVYIMDNAEHFLPMYLRFIKGVIDSNDLPLNISRELLQSNRVIDKIRSACVKRILGTLERMAANDSDKYAEFWKTFGALLKEGPAEDSANRDRIAKLLRFSTTHTGTEAQTVSLADYIGRMKEKQDKIYYLVGDTFAGTKNSPLLEVFAKKGIEVILMSDRIDEWLMAHLKDYEGVSFQSIAKGELDIDNLSDEEETESSKEESQQKQEKVKEEFASTLDAIKNALGERVKEVRLTERLTDSPACVVFDENELTGHMQRLLAATGQEVPASQPILELNASHALLQGLQTGANQDIALWSEVLLSQALLAEGETLKDPSSFVRSLNTLLGR